MGRWTVRIKEDCFYSHNTIIVSLFICVHLWACDLRLLSQLHFLDAQELMCTHVPTEQHQATCSMWNGFVLLLFCHYKHLMHY